MEKRKSESKYPPFPQGTVQDIKVIERAAKRIERAVDIFCTPPPWTQEWLDRNGLIVKYRGGKAILAIKE